jgi:hypothetical protein
MVHGFAGGSRAECLSALGFQQQPLVLTEGRAMQSTNVEQVTPHKLSKQFGSTPRWWQRTLPRLHAIGKVGKRGRLFFGNLQTIAEWLACTGEASEKHS